MTSPADQPYEPGTYSTDEPVPERPPVTSGRPAGRPRRGVQRTKTGYTWVGLVLAALLGIIVLSFILQNLDNVDLHLLFWDFSLPLGVTVLLSVIVGVLLTALVGGARIMQLRRAAKRR